MRSLQILKKKLVVGLWVLLAADAAMAAELSGPRPTLWYQQPAARWLEALPIGNGRLGAMVHGGVAEERISLNESTFWSGGPSDEHDDPSAAAAFARIRKQLKAGEHQGISADAMLGRRLNYGTHLPVGDLILGMHPADARPTGYRRELNLDEGIAAVDYSIDGVRFRREALVSNPDNVVALRLTADQPGRINLRVSFKANREPSQTRAEGNDTLLIAAGARETIHSDGKTGVSLAGVVRIVATGGKVSSAGDSITVTSADAVTVLVLLNTNFKSPEPASLGKKQLAGLQNTAFETLRKRHVADHQRLFRRMSLDLGASRADALPTDERLARLRGGEADPGLMALYFQYGRYLLIAGSRADSPLPMNLQGIWNDNFACEMAWTCDFHLDINTQQIYWPAEVGNLSECHEPLFRFIESLQEPGNRTARKTYGIDNGWVCHVFSNAWGFTAPGWGAGWGLHVTGGAWISSHLWERYLFTGDRRFLAERAYPVLKGAAMFFLDYLYPDPSTGHLMTGPSVSPERGGENGPGCVHDRAMVYQLFSDCITASRILKLDADFRSRLEAALAKLPPYKVGRNGQLQEWFHLDDGGETNHRHTSHLVGLFPLEQITPGKTPELARAAERSLDLRLQRPDWEDVEWSAGNNICYYARLGKGGEAHKHLANLMGADSDTSLLAFSRGGIAGAENNIFSIDGNTAGTAGVAEMLLQSHGGEISLLPALPEAWPEGEVKGLRARGGFEIDLKWSGSRLTTVRIRNISGRFCSLRYGTKIQSLDLKPGEIRDFDSGLAPIQ